MKIRALTFHVDPELLKGDLSRFSPTLSDLINDVYGKFGIEIWTKRLALAPQPAGRVAMIAEKLERGLSDEIDYIAIPIVNANEDDIPKILEVLSMHRRIFISLSGNEVQLRVFQKLLELILNRLSPEHFVKVSFSIKSHILTPYFPAASAVKGRIGVSAALLYVGNLVSALRNNGSLTAEIKACYNAAMCILNFISNKLSIDNFGIDLSISPWMDDSVARLIEMVSGEDFYEPATYHAIFKLNERIREIVNEGFKCIGFNEVMLPYAEDSRLMELGKEGKLTAYNLLSLSAVCVAGFDMAVLPKMSSKILRNFLLDIYALLKSKGKPSGIRVVLTENEPGEMADLGFLGRAPVMKLK
ncbi:MAG: DUF711 family protein [archaeon GB-1867-005]|nr:DUF711 family protein [Candidatus Culexmicrobium cathedralense]